MLSYSQELVLKHSCANVQCDINVLTIQSRNKRIPASVRRNERSICRDAAVKQRDQCSSRRLFDKYPHSETRSPTRSHTFDSLFLFSYFIDSLSQTTHLVRDCQETEKIAPIFPDLIG